MKNHTPLSHKYHSFAIQDFPPLTIEPPLSLAASHDPSHIRHPRSFSLLHLLPTRRFSGYKVNDIHYTHRVPETCELCMCIAYDQCKKCPSPTHFPSILHPHYPFSDFRLFPTHPYFASPPSTKQKSNRQRS